MERDVCAVVVTYHPTAEHLANVFGMRPQVPELVVVDNGSSEQAVAALREEARRSASHLIENGRNLGLAAALNLGVRWAQARGSEWVVFFDQDSRIPDGLIAAMLATYDADPDRESIGTLAPCYLDRVSGNELLVERSRAGEILTVSTSGSLVPLSVFDRCGYFREDFFVDQVDFEFCLRMIASGYRIVQCADAKLVHSVGERKEYAIGKKHLLTSTHHSSARRYYITRNRVMIVRSYWRRFPGYCSLLFRLMIKDTAKILLVERKKVIKLASIARGLTDGILGRMGKQVEL